MRRSGAGAPELQSPLGPEATCAPNHPLILLIVEILEIVIILLLIVKILEILLQGPD